MIIDNGSRPHLVIPGVYDGPAGRSGDVLVFQMKRRPGGNLDKPRAATMDGEAVTVRLRTPAIHSQRRAGLWEAVIL